MKKLVLTIALVLGFATLSFADPDGGVFGRGNATKNSNSNNRSNGLLLPGAHGDNQDWNGEEDDLPLGSGIAVLMGLGAAYLVGKKRKEE